MAEFKNSIAQSNVNFPIETVIVPIAGENYSRGMIFMNVDKKTDCLPGLPTAKAGDLVELNANNFQTISGGALKDWLVPFFTNAATSKIGVALFDEDDAGGTPATAPLASVYEAKKMYAYFKFGYAEEAKYNALQEQLAGLCKADGLYSVLWVHCFDNQILAGSSQLMTALKDIGGRVRVIYNPDKKINAALAQLGISMSSVNDSGTPVGNSIDMVAFNTIKASGAVDSDGNAANLSATEKAALDGQKVGYNTWCGDGTENVVTEGSLYINGDNVGAEWVKAFVEYSCKVKGASYITRLNTFNNHETYQGILLILSSVVEKFTAFGRLSNFTITAPLFEDLPPANGDQIIVPNAWEATYVDNVREVTVYGKLYLLQPTR